MKDYKPEFDDYIFGAIFLIAGIAGVVMLGLGVYGLWQAGQEVFLGVVVGAIVFGLLTRWFTRFMCSKDWFV